MRIVRNTQIQFMKQYKLFGVLSLSLIVLSVALVLLRGLNFGVDFTGGVVVELKYPQAADLEQIRTQAQVAGFEDFEVQYFGSAKDVVVRLSPETDNNAQVSEILLRELRKIDTQVQLSRVEFVGPKVGEELREDGGLALLYALFGILMYVAFRFEYRFALGSIVALIHDVLLTIGFFSLTGLQFDLSVLAAILAVIGYSLNDTIVVYDRIRENFVRYKKQTTEGVINQSLNQTLSRTLITSMTTLMVLMALLVFGGEGILPFTVAMIVGVIVGTYSSIYIAGTSLMLLGIKTEDMQTVKKEGEEFGKV